uniref:Uncharacterized protein n=1 Tax=Leptocylindrus danicus TaxID=163516 RepID=A0A7S2NSH1_9STRA|mmetsp:Transcript_11837/g.17857  ORF Transcript_11837/g.17857 Transcript_11837/m.17857 type:complete len:105 (+) Transcript_11837:689-1003(+)
MGGFVVSKIAAVKKNRAIKRAIIMDRSICREKLTLVLKSKNHERRNFSVLFSSQTMNPIEKSVAFGSYDLVEFELSLIVKVRCYMVDFSTSGVIMIICDIAILC